MKCLAIEDDYLISDLASLQKLLATMKAADATARRAEQSEVANPHLLTLAEMSRTNIIQVLDAGWTSTASQPPRPPTTYHF